MACFRPNYQCVGRTNKLVTLRYYVSPFRRLVVIKDARIARYSEILIEWATSELFSYA